MRAPILNAVQFRHAGTSSTIRRGFTSDIQAMRSDILSQDSLPASLAMINRQSLLDPWGQPYVYIRLAAANSAPRVTGRTDRFGNPVNSGFDLYSLGKDGASAQSFSAASSVTAVARRLLAPVQVAKAKARGSCGRDFDRVPH